MSNKNSLVTDLRIGDICQTYDYGFCTILHIEHIKGLLDQSQVKFLVLTRQLERKVVLFNASNIMTKAEIAFLKHAKK